MPFVAVTNSTTRGQDPALTKKLIRDVVVPRLQRLPGFQSARYGLSLDESSAIGTSVFDTEANAKKGLDAMMTGRPPEAPIITNTAIYEVIVEA
jgi:hypothetical protein